jgi:pyruvate formate lyase activating enzyme
MTEKVLRDLVDAGLDAINIDIKGDAEMVQKYCGTDVEKVWRNAKLAKELGIHVEITTLLIQGFNSDNQVVRKIVKRIFDDLDEFTPYHISRFFPHYKSDNYELIQPTPLDLLHNAYNTAKGVGLKYVYLGNLGIGDYNNTFCPKCNKLVVKRSLLGTEELLLDSKGNCRFCGYPISIV